MKISQQNPETDFENTHQKTKKKKLTKTGLLHFAAVNVKGVDPLHGSFISWSASPDQRPSATCGQPVEPSRPS
ncbi:unnamed protein product, partial [Nesidiocoris tenuis]